MTHTFTLHMGYAYANTTLYAQLYDVDGVATGDPITTGFAYDTTTGIHLWSYEIADDFSGFVKFFASSTVVPLLAAGISPPAVNLTADGLDAVLVEGSINARQCLAIISAVLAGKLVVSGTDTTIYAIDDPATVRVVSDNERETMTITLP